MKKTKFIKKLCSLALAGTMLFSLAGSISACDKKQDDNPTQSSGGESMIMVESSLKITRQRLFSGYDGVSCKDSPGVASDGNNIILNWGVMGLQNSDFSDYGEISVSNDRGETFSEPSRLTAIEEIKDDIRYTFAGTETVYSKKYDTFFTLGIQQQIPLNATSPLLKSKLAFVLHDKQTFNRCGEMKTLEFPFESHYPVTHGQAIEDSDGNFLLTVYFAKPLADEKYRSVALRYSFDGSEFKLLEAGTPIENDSLDRGVYEPSVVKVGNKYYMTLRSNENAYLAWSDDGLHYSEPVLWKFDDGSILGSCNTQQRWILHQSILGDEQVVYLVYTRKNGMNDHVFRNRAPLYISKFDTTKKCLIKDTERILVPEMGASLASMIGVCSFSDTVSYVSVAENMQWDAEQYGADNSIWLVRIHTQIDYKK